MRRIEASVTYYASHPEEIGRRLYVPFHGEGIISQFDGYEQLEEFDWEGYRQRYHDIQRLDRVLEAVLSGFDLGSAEERPLFYSCRCSRERLHRHLAAVPPEQLAEYQLTDGTIEGECVFCGHKYHFLPEDLAPPS